MSRSAGMLHCQIHFRHTYLEADFQLTVGCRRASSVCAMYAKASQHTSQHRLRVESMSHIYIYLFTDRSERQSRTSSVCLISTSVPKHRSQHRCELGWIILWQMALLTKWCTCIATMKIRGRQKREKTAVRYRFKLPLIDDAADQMMHKNRETKN